MQASEPVQNCSKNQTEVISQKNQSAFRQTNEVHHNVNIQCPSGQDHGEPRVLDMVDVRCKTKPPLVAVSLSILISLLQQMLSDQMTHNVCCDFLEQ